jgi:hypothetical protein
VALQLLGPGTCQDNLNQNKDFELDKISGCRAVEFDPDGILDWDELDAAQQATVIRRQASLYTVYFNYCLSSDSDDLLTPGTGGTSSATRTSVHMLVSRQLLQLQIGQPCTRHRLTHIYPPMHPPTYMPCVQVAFAVATTLDLLLVAM